MKVDAVILTALVTEKNAADEVMKQDSSVKVYNGIHYDYNVYTLRRSGLRVAIAKPSGMGQINAAVGASKMLVDLHPTVTLLIGIAGCMVDKSRGNMFLGDLVIADQIHDYELKKKRNGVVEPRYRTYGSSAELLPLIRNKAADTTWTEGLVERPGDKSVPSKVHIGDVLSGNVVLADKNMKSELLSERPNTPAIAIEMEAAGVASVLKGYNDYNRFLMIKGLCDWAEDEKDDTWQPYCCKAAALYTRYLLDVILGDYIRRLPSPPDHDVFRRHSHAALECYLESQTTRVPFLRKMAESIYENAVKEIQQLTQLNHDDGPPYNFAINPGSQFLVRVKELFGQAKRFYATSLDFVSTFWIDDNNTSMAKEYISAQMHIKDRENVKRLFVFSSPESAHRHSRRLDAHAKCFPNTFVCSKDDYLRLIRPLIQNPDRNIYRYMTEDFSISFYDMGDHREQGFYSGLNADALSFAPVRDIPAEGDIDCRRFIAIMEELAKLEDGTIATGSHVLKWNARLDESKSWTDKLSHLFGDRNADVFHVLWFNVDDTTYNKIRTTLAKIKYKILDGEHAGANSLANKYGIENLWLVKRIEGEHLEPISKGKIHYHDASKFKYLMIMKITKEDKLNEFLADRENTKLRLQLFRELGGDITDFMVAHGVDTIEGLRASPLARLNYQILERLAASKLRRFDFRDDELIEEIVHAKPPAF